MLKVYLLPYAVTLKIRKRSPKSNEVPIMPQHYIQCKFSSKPPTSSCADLEGVTGGLDPLKNHNNIGFLSNTDPDPLENHNATKPAFNDGPSLACHKNAI